MGAAVRADWACGLGPNTRQSVRRPGGRSCYPSLGPATEKIRAEMSRPCFTSRWPARFLVSSRNFVYFATSELRLSLSTGRDGRLEKNLERNHQRIPCEIHKPTATGRCVLLTSHNANLCNHGPSSPGSGRLSDKRAGAAATAVTACERAACCVRRRSMGWWESMFGDGGDGGNVGCFRRIGRKHARNSYAFPADPGSGTFSGLVFAPFCFWGPCLSSTGFDSGTFFFVILLFLFALIVWPLGF